MIPRPPLRLVLLAKLAKKCLSLAQQLLLIVGENNMNDKKERSIAKAFSWRGLAVLALGAITYGITDDMHQTSIITIIYHGLQVGIFFFHERIWSHVNWGRTTGLFIQMTGLSGAGKSTIAKKVQKGLIKKGFRVEVIDGDEYREGLCSDLGFSKEDRNTNIRRLGFVGKVLARNDVITIMSAINPYEEIRKELRELSGKSRTVFINCGLEELKKRDTKGLYRKALLPDEDPEKINNFTGISDPFDSLLVCDLIINTEKETIEQSAARLEKFILENI